MTALKCLSIFIINIFSFIIEGSVEFFEMDDGTLINAATYNTKNIAMYQEYDEMLAPPIVLLHGFMNSRRYWDPLLSMMVNSTLFSEHPIITISFRGMGDSQYINLETANNYMTNIDDIFTVLSQIGINNNIKCIFIGQSFGSMITNQIVINKLSRVYGIILMGTLAYIDDIIDNIIDSFKWHDGNNWSYSLQAQVNTNWDVPYNDKRINKEFYDLMKSEQSKFKFEIMTKTEFRPYDLRNAIQSNKYFSDVPIVVVRGNLDFIPYATVQPLMNIGSNVKVLDYKCNTCDHDIVYGNEQEIIHELYHIIHDKNPLKTDL